MNYAVRAATVAVLCVLSACAGRSTVEVDVCEPPGLPVPPDVNAQGAFGACYGETSGAPAWNSGVGFAVCTCCGGDLCAWRLLDCEETDKATCEALGGQPSCEVCDA